MSLYLQNNMRTDLNNNNYIFHFQNNITIDKKNISLSFILITFPGSTPTWVEVPSIPV